jgi:hypothetical protein
MYRFYIDAKQMVDYRLISTVFGSFSHTRYVTVLELWNPQYDPKTGKEPTEGDLVEVLNSDKFLSKYIIIHDKLGVPASLITQGWAVTTDKYQGHQSQTVIVDFQPKDGDQFTQEHGLVGISRAKERMIVLGNVAELSAMTRNYNTKRMVDLEWRLEDMMNSL